uniref:Glucosamine/galactosamine-6-phosphate isomerase domain-containing protein n=1 Tax=Kalanchoe fedtschenkoi TaxID=63787 RepID=A0A7N0TS01_KALFE
MAMSWKHGERGEVRVFEDEQELSTDLVDYIADLSEAAVKERGVFAVALSGGSLIGLMGKLCEAPYDKTVDWSKWYVFWVDERVVAKNHVDSNYKLAKEAFLSKVSMSCLGSS